MSLKTHLGTIWERMITDWRLHRTLGVGRIYAIVESEKVNIWKLKTSTARYLVCHVCGIETHWGRGKGPYLLCDEHNKWRTYFKLTRKVAQSQRTR